MLRLAESQIKAGILHPIEEVRRTALEYFADAYTSDQSIMPLVIEAVERYGEISGFRLLRRAEDLPQTDQTLDWLVSELKAENRLDDYRFALGLILCCTAPELLLSHGVDPARLRHFPRRLLKQFHERLEIYQWDWENTWRAFLGFAAELQAKDDFTLEDSSRLRALGESLGRHGDREDLRGRLLGGYNRTVDRELIEWMDFVTIELVGQLRFKEAVPLLLQQFHADNLWVCDSCLSALARIGGDDVVRALAAEWPRASPPFRGWTTNVLDHIHTDLCAEVLLEFLTSEEDPEIQRSLSHSMLYQFAYDAVKPAALIIQQAQELDAERLDLRYHLMAAATLMNVQFPQYEQWYRFCEQTEWGWKREDYAIPIADVWWRRGDRSEWN